MNSKSKHKKAMIIVLFIVIAFSLSTSTSYAYWAKPSLTHVLKASSSITIGHWTIIPTWNSTKNYKKGDQVTLNGITYEASRQNKNVQPGGNFWTFWWIYWVVV